MSQSVASNMVIFEIGQTLPGYSSGQNLNNFIQ